MPYLRKRGDKYVYERSNPKGLQPAHGRINNHYPVGLIDEMTKEEAQAKADEFAKRDEARWAYLRDHPQEAKALAAINGLAYVPRLEKHLAKIDAAVASYSFLDPIKHAPLIARSYRDATPQNLTILKTMVYGIPALFREKFGEGLSVARKLMGPP